MADHAGRDAAHEGAVGLLQAAPSHDDDAAVLGVGQVHDAFVGLAFLSDGLDQHPLFLGKPLRVVERVFVGFRERGEHIAPDAGEVEIAGERRDHRRVR